MLQISLGQVKFHLKNEIWSKITYRNFKKAGAESTGLLIKPGGRQHVAYTSGEHQQWEIDVEKTREVQKTKCASQQSNAQWTLAMPQGDTGRGSNLQRWTRLWGQKPAFTSAMPWALWISLMMQVKGMPVSSVPWSLQPFMTSFSSVFFSPHSRLCFVTLTPVLYDLIRRDVFIAL